MNSCCPWDRGWEGGSSQHGDWGGPGAMFWAALIPGHAAGLWAELPSLQQGCCSSPRKFFKGDSPPISDEVIQML